MLQNAYLLAKIGADTAENERNFAKNWQLPYGSTTLRAGLTPTFFELDHPPRVFTGLPPPGDLRPRDPDVHADEEFRPDEGDLPEDDQSLVRRFSPA